jgi:uncharacterized protein
MTLGLGTKFNILQQSPHDFQTPEAGEKATSDEPEATRWIPSRYTVRAVTADGRLVLWNTFNGNMSVIRPELRESVERLLQKRGFAARPLGIVRFLHERGFLIEASTNEYRQFQLGFGKEHYRSDRLELILLASEDCNFRCEYCYEDFARGTMQPAVRQGVKNLVHKQLGRIRSLSVDWFGGEPLYGLEAIEDLAPFFQKTARENNLQYSSSMTTNGYLLSPEVAAPLLDWEVNSFQITLDGPPEMHNRSRPTRDNRDSFSTIFSNLMELRRRSEPFRVDLRINFDQKNHPELPQLLSLIERELGGDSRFKLRFHRIGQWGGKNDENLAVCGIDDAARISRSLKEEARKKGLSLADDIREIHGMGAHACYAARPYSFIVGASGKLMKCTIELDKNDRNVVGRLTEEGELELDPDRLALWTEPAFEKDHNCQKCVILPVCQGIHCPLIRMETGKSPCTPLKMSYKKDLREAARESR